MEELTEKELTKFQEMLDKKRNPAAEAIRKNGEEIVKTITEHGI